MSEIKTLIAERLSDIFSLISPIKWMRTSFVVSPVIDYLEVMKQTIYYKQTKAGNVFTYIYPDPNEQITIKLGYTTVQCDGNAGNRYLNYTIYDDDSGVIYALLDLYSTVYVALDTKTRYVSDIDWYKTQGTPPASFDEQFILPPIEHPNCIEIEVSGGKAGDNVYTVLKLESSPHAIESSRM